MITIRRKIGICALGAVLSFGTLFTTVSLQKNVIVQAASSISVQANAAISSLESSLKRNYLGSKNLPTFNSYLKNAKTLTNKLPNGSTKTSYNNRIAETERIIRATESVVVLETSLEKNYHGMRNVPTFNSYIDKANKAIALINTNVCRYKLSDRTYLAFNTVRDIEVVNSSEYITAANKFVEARKLYRSAVKEQTNELKTKALETANDSLSFGWKIRTSVAKDYLISDIKDLIKDINKIEVKENNKEENTNADKKIVEEKKVEDTEKDSSAKVEEKATESVAKSEITKDESLADSNAVKSDNASNDIVEGK